MTVTKFLDTKLDKDTDDIIFVDHNDRVINLTDYDGTSIKSIKYNKVAIIKIK